jgi:hypothetical protein
MKMIYESNAINEKKNLYLKEFFIKNNKKLKLTLCCLNWDTMYCGLKSKPDRSFPEESISVHVKKHICEVLGVPDIFKFFDTSFFFAFATFHEFLNPQYNL